MKNEENAEEFAPAEKSIAATACGGDENRDKTDKNEEKGSEEEEVEEGHWPIEAKLTPCCKVLCNDSGRESSEYASGESGRGLSNADRRGQERAKKVENSA